MAKTQPVETPAFSLESGLVTLEENRRYPRFSFEAPVTRHLDGNIKIHEVNLCMFDRDGRFIARERSVRDRTVFANRARWVHEVRPERLAHAKRLVYTVNYRFNVSRTLISGELPPVPYDIDISELCPWLLPEKATLADRTAQFELALWATGSDVVVSFGQAPKLLASSFRTTCELDLLDANREVIIRHEFSSSIEDARPSYETSDVPLGRKTMRSLAFFEVRAHTEVSTAVDIEIDQADN